MLYTTSEIQDTILTRMKLHFNDVKKALDWYQTPNCYFNIWRRGKVSPAEMVKLGKGEDVLTWIEATIGLQKQP